MPSIIFINYYTYNKKEAKGGFFTTMKSRKVILLSYSILLLYFCGDDNKSKDCNPPCGPGTHPQNCVCVPDNPGGDGDLDIDSEIDIESDLNDDISQQLSDRNVTGDTQDNSTTLASVRGTIHRNALMYLREGAGQGDLYAGVYDKCPLGFEGPFTTSYFVVVGEDVDVRDSAINFPYIIENIPPGHWYVMGFLDDDEDANPTQPLPDSGDMIPQSPPGCTEIDLSQGEIKEVNIVLENYYP